MFYTSYKFCYLIIIFISSFVTHKILQRKGNYVLLRSAVDCNIFHILRSAEKRATKERVLSSQVQNLRDPCSRRHVFEFDNDVLRVIITKNIWTKTQYYIVLLTLFAATRVVPVPVLWSPFTKYITRARTNNYKSTSVNERFKERKAGKTPCAVSERKSYFT